MANSVLDWLDASADRFPDRVAFRDADGASVTFRALRDAAARIGGGLLRAVPDGAGRAAAVLCGRSAGCVAAFLGAVWAGMYYVPVDADLPPERRDLLLARTNAAAVIDCVGASDGCLTPAQLGGGEAAPRVRTRPDDPLYGIFTSGSTGEPKLVLKSHRAIVSFIECYADLFGFAPEDILANQIPFSFDASTKDLFTVLRTGCTAVVLPKALFAQPGRLADCLTRERVTSVCWVPSALCMLSRFNVFSKYPFPDLRRVQFVGEPMPPRQLAVWMNALPGAVFTNLYGATENAGNCLYHTFSAPPEGDRVPVGRPFPNVRVFLLDEEDREIPPSDIETTGEICLCGDTLAIGYAGDPEATAEKFTRRPGGEERMYRTGDIGRYDEAGELLCLGRRDGQIKLQGCRIELGDIEAAAETFPGVDRACCLFDEARGRLVLVCAGEDCAGALAAHLRARLPAYMLPGKYIFRERLPLNPNGKIHRTALRAEYIG